MYRARCTPLTWLQSNKKKEGRHNFCTSAQVWEMCSRHTWMCLKKCVFFYIKWNEIKPIVSIAFALHCEWPPYRRKNKTPAVGRRSWSNVRYGVYWKNNIKWLKQHMSFRSSLINNVRSISFHIGCKIFSGLIQSTNTKMYIWLTCASKLCVE